MANNIHATATGLSILPDKADDLFIHVGLRMMSTRPNANGEGVTEAFIAEIAAHPDKYEGLPLYADMDALMSRDYGSLGHMLDRATGTFGTAQIGSIGGFTVVDDAYGTSLLAEARVPKRQADICERVIELYEMGALNFSFEIRHSGENVQDKSGVTYLDAAEGNILMGMAVVSVPAYRESKALAMVAEENRQGVDGTMTLDEAVARIAELEAAATAKEQTALAEANELKAAAATAGDELATARAELETSTAEKVTLAAELEEVKSELAKRIAAERDAELAQKRKMAEKLAAAMGFDIENEDVARLIAAGDLYEFAYMYERVCEKTETVKPGSETPAIAEAEPGKTDTETAPKPTVAIAEMVEGDVKLNTPYGGLLERG